MSFGITNINTEKIIINEQTVKIRVRIIKKTRLVNRGQVK